MSIINPPKKKGYKIYSCHYSHDGELSEARFAAKDRQDAEARLRSLAETGEVKRFLVEEDCYERASC